MSGVALDIPVSSAQPRSFLRLLWAVFVGYFLASVMLLVLAVPLFFLEWLPRPFAYPGPFPVDGAWSLDADLVVALVVVLVAAWSIRLQVELAVRGHVSFGVVALVVAITGYAPFLALRPAKVVGLIALPVATWLIRRYAIGATMPFQRPSWRTWLVLAVIGVAVFGSYRAYHPLTSTGGGFGAIGVPHGKQFRQLELRNSDWANLTILRVDGGWIGPTEGGLYPFKLPYTVHSRARIGLYASGRVCVPRDVDVTFSVLGRTATQRFPFQPDTVASGFHTGNVPAC